MAYFLKFNGVNRQCIFPKAISFNIGTSDYALEVSMILNALPAAGQGMGILGRNGTVSGFVITPSGSLALYATNTLRYQTAAGFFIADATDRVYRIEHDASGSWRAYVDGVLFDNGTFSLSVQASNHTRIGTATGSVWFLNADVAYIELTGPVNAARWDANLSGGTGTVLPTLGSTNNATQSGSWPTDDSEWVFYDGGDEEEDPVFPSIKYWNGTLWVSKPLKIWSGSAWTAPNLNRYNGSSWVAVP